ncbi:aldo/keto reductase [Chryseobacterium carnipullorum]|uniref:Aldo/keto reductase n=1 Tax=Chryseobacterium carnipullorum TaxID=1124835 RepID=A0A376DNL1_CHRCU|nr:aldo/keto reductase [Chryseobacterium carnipullorum]AZA48487.1 aldo/keto reductase [Chryseobacterium carnipullorum]AZA63414.1 aldo/keto reductase [Chryseobacterium carnipullorum]STC92472.1 Oxidoreductase YdhF [Chryseobacterium carnipullorum]
MDKKSFSKIIAGTMTWGVWGKNCSTQQMIELMNCCLENNITTFDHADIYGDYTTEAEFGKAFNESKIDRSTIQLISKCGIQMESDKRNNFVKHYDYATSYIIGSVEQSLRNLQTDYLDLLLLHRPSPLMRADDIAEAIAKLKQDGKILDFGVSNFTPLQTDLIETKIKINYNQISFSITDFEAMTNGSLDHMQTRNITPMCWSPLGTVFRQDDDQTRRLKKILANFSDKYEVPADIILLAWILKHPAGILPVCGTADPSRLANLMKATTVNMELQDWFALWSESTGVPVP